MARHRSPGGTRPTASGPADRELATVNTVDTVDTVPTNRAARRAADARHRRSQSGTRFRIGLTAAGLAAAGLLIATDPGSLDAAQTASAESDILRAQATDRASAVASGPASRGDRPAPVGPPAAPAEPPVAGPPAEDLSVLLETVPCPSSGFGGVSPHVAQVGYLIMQEFGLSESEIGGVAGRPGNPTSDHPNGLALDFMVDNATGDAINAYLSERIDEFAITYILWQVPAHYDHVHVSFSSSPGETVSCAVTDDGDSDADAEPDADADE